MRRNRLDRHERAIRRQGGRAVVSAAAATPTPWTLEVVTSTAPILLIWQPAQLAEG